MNLDRDAHPVEHILENLAVSRASARAPVFPGFGLFTSRHTRERLCIVPGPRPIPLVLAPRNGACLGGTGSNQQGDKGSTREMESGKERPLLQWFLRLHAAWSYANANQKCNGGACTHYGCTCKLGTEIQVFG